MDPGQRVRSAARIRAAARNVRSHRARPAVLHQDEGQQGLRLRGYHESLHLRALRLLTPSGILATFSCSHHVTAQDWTGLLERAAAETNLNLRLRAHLRQSSDHPILVNVPETEYLHGYVLEKIGARYGLLCAGLVASSLTARAAAAPPPPAAPAIKATDADNHTIVLNKPRFVSVVIGTSEDSQDAARRAGRAMYPFQGMSDFQLIVVVDLRDTIAAWVPSVVIDHMRTSLDGEAIELKPYYLKNGNKNNPRKFCHVVPDFKGTIVPQINWAGTPDELHAVVYGPDGREVKRWENVDSMDNFASTVRAALQAYADQGAAAKAAWLKPRRRPRPASRPPAVSMNSPRSQELFAEALRYLPGGVNSPVRAFRAVGGAPFFARRAHGSRLEDADGNSYIDYVTTWGPPSSAMPIPKSSPRCRPPPRKAPVSASRTRSKPSSPAKSATGCPPCKKCA